MTKVSPRRDAYANNRFLSLPTTLIFDREVECEVSSRVKKVPVDTATSLDINRKLPMLNLQCAAQL